MHRLLVGTARLIIMGDWNFVPDVTTPYDRMGGGGANGGSSQVKWYLYCQTGSQHCAQSH
jgi:hypothetical protein